MIFLLFRAHSVLLVCFLSEFGLHRFLETDTQGGTSSLPLFGVAAVSTVLRYPSSLKSRQSGLVVRIFDISHPPQGSNSDPRKHDRFATKRPFPSPILNHVHNPSGTVIMGDLNLHPKVYLC
jgi:hypothetical protein